MTCQRQILHYREREKETKKTIKRKWSCRPGYLRVSYSPIVFYAASLILYSAPGTHAIVFVFVFPVLSLAVWGWGWTMPAATTNMKMKGKTREKLLLLL